MVVITDQAGRPIVETLIVDISNCQECPECGLVFRGRSCPCTQTIEVKNE